MTTYNLADLIESVVDAVGPDRRAVVVGDRRLTFADVEARANRLAHVLADRGVGPGDHVGLQLLNGSEYIEGMLACFKLRAVPINVNYRYVENELAYLYDDADLVALVFHRSMSDRVAAVAPSVPGLTTLIDVDTEGVDLDPPPGAVEYETALADASPARDFGPRSGDDLYIAYTGGTTGMPKGVMWRHEDCFFGCLGGGDPWQSGDFVTSPDQVVERLGDGGLVYLATPPLMHVSAHWNALMGLLQGGTTVLMPHGRFDPSAIWTAVADNGVNVLVIVGDAMGKPLVAEHRARADEHDLSSLIVIGSGGAVLSPSTKQELSEIKEGLMIVDGLGSSEMGPVGTKAHTADAEAERPKFTLNAQTAVLDEHHRRVAPGSGVIGQVARCGNIPIGYYNDPDKTARSFVEVDGERWVLSGDMATVEPDGTVVLLGRGSVSINTGGEKVYPEEVELAAHEHPAIDDCVAVGVPDDRWGERVVLVASLTAGHGLDADALADHCRTRLAGYKVPRDLVVVDSIVRSPAGKADYRWAAALAAERLSAATT